jgi:dynein assembly factor 3
MEAIGFTQLWGSTPAINCFDGCDNIDPAKDDKEINILMTETGGDGRHLFKTICDILPLETERKNPINIYFHERQKENLGRLVLFLTLFCETGMSQRERMEIFLDLFGNCLIRDKTQ